MGQIVGDYIMLENTAAELDDVVAGYSGSVTTLYNLVDELNAMWEGDTKDAFVSTFNTKRATLEDVAILFNEYSNAIRGVASEFRGAEQRSIDVIRQA